MFNKFISKEALAQEFHYQQSHYLFAISQPAEYLLPPRWPGGGRGLSNVTLLYAGCLDLLNNSSLQAKKSSPNIIPSLSMNTVKKNRS